MSVQGFLQSNNVPEIRSTHGLIVGEATNTALWSATSGYEINIVA